MAKIKKEKKISRINLYLTIALLAISALAGYFYWQGKKTKSPTTPVNIITQKNDSEILKIIQPMAENFIQNFVQGDFIKASQDFDNEMKININTQVLGTVQGETLSKIGDLVNLGQPKITTKQTNFLFLEYPEAKFSQEEKVFIRIVFKNDSGGNLKISGFSFDSPKMNDSSN